MAFASRHGATEEIAAAVAATLRDQGFEVDVRSADAVTEVERYRAVVLGSALYAGSWLKPALDLAERRRAVLAGLPVWLFSSGPIGEVTPEDREQPHQRSNLDEWLLPEGHATFAGRLDVDRLSFAERMITRALKVTPGDYREWETIRGWAEEIASALGPPVMG